MKKQIVLMVDEELYEAIKNFAKYNNRSVAGAVRWILYKTLIRKEG